MQKVSEKINDETPFAITLKPLTSLENHTGAWRTLKPAYNFHEPPCSATCPAGERCRDWLFLAEDAHEDAGHDEQRARRESVRTLHTLVGVESPVYEGRSVHKIDRLLLKSLLDAHSFSKRAARDFPRTG